MGKRDNNPKKQKDLPRRDSSGKLRFPGGKRGKARFYAKSKRKD